MVKDGWRRRNHLSGHVPFVTVLVVVVQNCIQAENAGAVVAQAAM